jgi:hypothetical protein
VKVFDAGRGATVAAGPMPARVEKTFTEADCQFVARERQVCALISANPTTGTRPQFLPSFI